MWKSSAVQKQNLFNRSRLCRIVRAKSMKEILKLCDGFVPGSTPQVGFWIRSCRTDLSAGVLWQKSTRLSNNSRLLQVLKIEDWPTFQGGRDACLREQLRLDSWRRNWILGSGRHSSAGVFKHQSSCCIWSNSVNTFSLLSFFYMI